MSEENMKSKGASVKLGTFVLLVILVAICFGGAGYLYGINTGKTITSATKTATATASVTSSKTAVASATSTANATAGWKSATISDLNISFKYPSEWGDYSVVNEGAETGTSKLIKFSNGPRPNSDNTGTIGVDTLILSYVSQGFEAGRSGTIAESLSYHKTTDIKTCSALKDAIKLDLSNCNTVNTGAGIAVYGKTTIFDDEAFAVLSLTNINFPVLSIQRQYKSSSDLDLVSQILSTFQFTK